MASQKEIQEPSMEEILSSIRRIIAEEDAQQPAAASAPTASAAPPPTAAASDGDQAEDVLELTEIADETPAAPPGPPEIELADAALPAEPVSVPAPTPPTVKEDPVLATTESKPELVSEMAASATTAAMARLARAALPEEPSAATPSSGKSVEQLVADMLRPMLKDWLDQNLPAIVERIVEQEVKKLARRAELL